MIAAFAVVFLLLVFLQPRVIIAFAKLAVSTTRYVLICARREEAFVPVVQVVAAPAERPPLLLPKPRVRALPAPKPEKPKDDLEARVAKFGLNVNNPRVRAALDRAAMEKAA